MKILIVHAHPETRSLNGSLKDFMVEHLTRSGHDIRVSDLYAMQWKAPLAADDFSHVESGARFDPVLDSLRGFEDGTQHEDITAEQAKLLWADAVIFQFPLWWYSMPAILKGWVERVYAYGFAYGVGEHSDTHWGDRFGQGTLAGKRAMLVVTAGGWAPHYSPRGINGPMDDLLFPIHHGILYYPGFDVLPPFVVYRTGKVDETAYARITGDLGHRLDALWTTAPIPFRAQNAGDYEIPALTLRPEIAPHRSGFAAHVAD
ncbi:NAD(P)H dehydrogenase (quinone) [Variovorax paradoxus]|uniref:NAD(P)H-dependent oxidoreductase n=1 Tax=Variovorax paradoxus TaxID=34073 RepID=UPI002791AC73|nr:NAD(P)H-dependent oxidoreductase [Variovorax paradoxus]MDQ0570975.1 NAD(P)H dehydrogenase (quinone) [Variovorax paradoxus]